MRRGDSLLFEFNADCSTRKYCGSFQGKARARQCNPKGSNDAIPDTGEIRGKLGNSAERDDGSDRGDESERPTNGANDRERRPGAERRKRARIHGTSPRILAGLGRRDGDSPDVRPRGLPHGRRRVPVKAGIAGAGMKRGRRRPVSSTGTEAFTPNLLALCTGSPDRLRRAARLGFWG